MTEKPGFDVVAAHRHFAAACFNMAWDLIGKTHRTADEDEQMIRLSQASLWHWTQREDCTRRNLSIGYWQASRINALLGQADNARRYGRLCLDHSQGEEPFYSGYAREALARAAAVAGEPEEMEEHLHEARQLAESVAKAEERRALLKDLDTIELKKDRRS